HMLADWRKGHIDDFTTLDRDLARLMEEVAPAFPKPWTALAHSMGGQILIRAAHDRPEWFSRFVFSAPMLGLRFPNRVISAAIRALTNALHLLGRDEAYVPGGSGKSNDEVSFEENILTHDERRYELLQALVRAEPKLGLGSATVGWLHAAFCSMEMSAAPSFLADVGAPVLIAQAQQDALVSPSSFQHAVTHLRDGTLVIVPDARHEILIERDPARAVFWKAFDEFTGIEKSTE